MRYVLLRCFDYEGCRYEKAFATLAEAQAYCQGREPWGGEWQVWDTMTNQEVLVIDP